MATDLYLISEDGKRAQYIRLENATVQDAIEQARSVWGQDVFVIGTRAAWRGAARSKGPPDESSIERRP